MKIFLSSKADRQLDKLPGAMHELILKSIEKLQITPFPSHSKKLAGRECWRLRIGDYRILYAVDKKRKEIAILSVAHRKDAYR